MAQILRQIERWKELLAADFVLSNPLKKEVEQSIRATELFVWEILIRENFPRVGPWTLKRSLLPTGQYEDGSLHYLRPATRMEAVHEDTQEKREVVIPGEIANDPYRMADAYRKAFEELGIYDLLLQGRVGQHLVSMRNPQGWPVFTQQVIPNLYEFLIPYYRTKGHFSIQRDRDVMELARGALFPGKLLEDMLEILRMEYPSWFAATTALQLKPDLQRYLERKQSSIKSHQ